MHRAVIIGGGFGGLYAARALKHENVAVTLVDRRNFHLFQPLLYQVATGALSPGEIAAPLRVLLRKQKNAQVLLADAVAASRDVAATSSRRAKVDRIATLLKAAGPGQSAVVVPWLSGELRQRRTGVGWATLKDAPPPTGTASLTVAEADGVFESVSLLAGPGSASERRRQVHDMFGRATPDEQRFLRGLISGELRQGASARSRA